MENNFKLNSLSDFKNLQEIGRGFFGKVYKAESSKTHSIYAIKEMCNENNKYIKREIQIMKTITNPYVVKLYDCFEDNNKIYIIMEYIPNGTLESFIKNNKGNFLSQEIVMHIFYQILGGLNYLHSNDIIHRDIKPDNILFNENGDIKISDFGLSALIRNKNLINNNSNELDSSLFFNSSFIGPLDFISPEVFKHQEYNLKSDIYSLGLTMFNLMTFDFFFSKENDSYDPIKERKRSNVQIDNKIYSDELIELINNMLKEEPNERPTANEALLILEKIIINFYQQKTRNEIKNLLKTCKKNNKKVESYSSKIKKSVEYEINSSTVENFFCNYNSSIFCFAQIIFRIEKLHYFFLENKNSIDTINEKGNLSKDIKQLMDNMDNLNCNNITVQDFFDKCLINFRKKISADLGLFKENYEIPPQELIETLFLYINEELKEIFIFPNTIFNQFEGNLPEFPKEKFPQIYETIESFKNDYQSQFVELFYFLSLKKYQCKFCENQILCENSINYCIFLSVSDELQRNVKDLFLNYEKGNQVQIIKEMKCNNCYFQSNVIKTSNTLFSSPKILIFFFKKEEKINKVNIRIEEEIDLSSHIISKIGPTKYYLHSLIFNNDSKNNTHYFAYIKNNSKEEKWIYFRNGKKNECLYENISNINQMPYAAIYIST